MKKPKPTHGKAQERLVIELNKIIQYYGMEYDITFADAIGCLEIVKNMIHKSYEEDEEDEEEW